MRIIAFTGPKHCGKDTAAKVLFDRNQREGLKLFRHAPMAEGVKRIAEDFFDWDLYDQSRMEFKETPREYWPGGPVEPPRQFLMDTANWMRERFGGGIHAARWANHAQHYENRYWGAHVTTDLRFPEELAVFEQYGDGKVGFLPIYVYRSEAEERLATLKAQGDKMANDPSESHYQMLLEYCQKNGAVISNNDAIHDLHNEVIGVVNLKLGHWKYWGEIPTLEVRN